MHSSRENRGPLFVFLLAILIASLSTSGCTGVASAPATATATTPGAGQLTVSPSSVSLSNTVGAAASQAVIATNSGTANLKVSQASVAGTGFSITGLTLPLSLSPGQSQNFTVMFDPATSGSVNGTLTIMTNASASAVVVPLQGTGAATTATVSSVTVAPSPATAVTSGSVQFTATVAGAVTNKSVTWKAAHGTITSAGLYTAPANAETDTVTATSVADKTKSGTSPVTVSTPVVTSVTVAPSPATAVTSGSVQFTATVAGTVTNKSVTWKAAHGTITSAGLYTAPAAAETDTVTATSVANTAKSGSSSVSVSNSVITSVAVSPSSKSVTTDATVDFTATVAGTVADKGVTWKTSLGSISAGGIFTAPSTAGTAKVTATSEADTSKSGTATVTVSSPKQTGPLPAFPGAEGGGAASAGGRGGQVIEVTNLHDTGSGSLRACLDASGPRTCIFRVAGIITPASQLRVGNPFVTVACQTAPGEIIIGGPRTVQDSMFITTHDVVVRYCTFSADNINVPSGPDTGTMNVEIANGDNYNIILDHITSRWAGNKLWLTLSNYVGPNRLITTQWSMFYEPHAGHPVGPGSGSSPSCVATSSSPCFSAGEHDIDFHHDLFADIHHRIPESTNHSTRFINNIVFNWGYYASEWLGAMTVDEIGNKYVAGNLNSEAQQHEIHFTTISPQLPGNPSVHLSGNIGPSQSDPSGNQYLMAARITGENGGEEGALPSNWIRSSPMAAPAFPISADPVGNLDSVLLGTVGNSRHLDCAGNWVSHRDSADQRIIKQYQTRGSGGYWPNGITDVTTSIPTPSSEWTDKPVTNFSACTESMHDGIPDQWKTEQGLSTTDPNLHKEVAPNGYTYLENYMNGPAGSASLKPNVNGWNWAATRPASDAGTATSRSARVVEENPVSGRGHF
jgi:hypothetical protein